MTEARKAAEERYPTVDGWPQSWQHLFVEGAEWQAARTPQITDEVRALIESALEDIQPSRFVAPHEMWYAGTTRDVQRARAALEAALGQTNDTRGEQK